MKYLLESPQMKEADFYTIHELGTPSLELMERAAKACVEFIDRAGWKTDCVCIVCGSGNNGGDGFAVGRLLLEQGITARVIFAGRMEGRTPETIWQMEQFVAAGGKIFTTSHQTEYTIVIDALFGIGLSREVTGQYREWIEAMNRWSGKKLAVDIPSGIHGSTGQVLGCGFQADITITFQEAKLGMVLYPGCSYVGGLKVADIGIDVSKVRKEVGTVCSLEEEDAAKLLPSRPENSHKGTFGKALLIAGSKGMAGAAYLSAYAAYLTGAGLVQIFTDESNRGILQQLLPEAILTTYDPEDLKELGHKLREKLEWADVICAGPGIGQEPAAEEILRLVLEQETKPCLIDADGLNLLARHREWQTKIRRGKRILTPHMKELARLTGRPLTEMKESPREILRSFSERFGAVLVMKDARTMIGYPGKRDFVNLTGNSAMAKAGSGDVLAGVITGLLAQGMDLCDGAVLGTYLHGMAGDLAREQLGSYSVLARDLAQQIQQVLKRLEKRKAKERT